jgi:hypothetical protein
MPGFSSSSDPRQPISSGERRLLPGEKEMAAPGEYRPDRTEGITHRAVSPSTCFATLKPKVASSGLQKQRRQQQGLAFEAPENEADNQIGAMGQMGNSVIDCSSWFFN